MSLASVRNRSVHFLPLALALDPQSDSSISAAVQQCLARCYQGGTPIGILAEFLGELREAEWPPEDLRRVEGAVRRVLAGLVSKDATANTHAEE